MIPAGCVERCPGCRYRGLGEEESDARKQAWAHRWFGPVAAPLRVPAARWAYRRKAVLHAACGERGWEFGLLRRRGRETELVPIPDCPLHAPELNARLACLRPLLPPDLPLAYVLASGAWLTLVLKCAPADRWRAWARGIAPDLSRAGVRALSLNWHAAAGRRVLSARHQEQVFGPDALDDGGVLHGAVSFRQQIATLESEAHALAQEWLAGPEPVIDLYCGVGTTLQRWRAAGRDALGVELGGEACALAARNAPGASVLKGKVHERLPQVEGWLAGREYALYTNPPREGMGEAVAAWLRANPPVRIAYLSCNLRTLASDLAALGPNFVLEAVHPFDFFPQTDHVEGLALLRRA